MELAYRMHYRSLSVNQIVTHFEENPATFTKDIAGLSIAKRRTTYECCRPVSNPQFVI